MKSISRSVLCIVLGMLLFTSCSSQSDIPNTSKAESGSAIISSTEADELEDNPINANVNDLKQETEQQRERNEKYFAIDKVVYDGINIQLKCTQITPNGIEFECSNLSEKEISVSLDIGLDGLQLPMWTDYYDTLIPAGATKTFLANCDINNLKHSVMSVYGIVFVDSTGEETFDICDIPLGGESNPEYVLPTGESQYSTDEINVEYVGADAQGLNFKIENLREKAISVYLEELYINDDPNDYSMYAITVPAHTSDIYCANILDQNQEYFSSNLSAFSGIMCIDIEGEGVVDRFPISMGSSQGSADTPKDDADIEEPTETASNNATLSVDGDHFQCTIEDAINILNASFNKYEIDVSSENVTELRFHEYNLLKRGQDNGDEISFLADDNGYVTYIQITGPDIYDLMGCVLYEIDKNADITGTWSGLDESTDIDLVGEKLHIHGSKSSQVIAIMTLDYWYNN